MLLVLLVLLVLLPLVDGGHWNVVPVEDVGVRGGSDEGDEVEDVMSTSFAA